MSRRRITAFAALISIFMGIFTASPAAADPYMDGTSEEVALRLVQLGMTADEFLQQANELQAVEPTVLTNEEEFLSVPTAVEFLDSGPLEGMASPPLPPLDDPDARASAEECGTFWGQITYYNAYRQPLMKFRSVKTACWNEFTQVTRSPDHWVEWATWRGWTFDGITNSHHRYSPSWQNGFHTTWKKGKFYLCFRYCMTKFPGINIAIGYTGHAEYKFTP